MNMFTVSLEEIFRFCRATPTTRNMREGQACLNSGLVIKCGTTARNSTKVQLYAICLRTSGITSDPHVISGSLSLRTSARCNDCVRDVLVDTMNCSCKAGFSHCCKHIVAVLLYCNRNNLADLAEISSTDKKCMWNRHKEPVLEQFKPLPTESFCCINQDRLPSLPDNKLMTIRKRLIECDSKTAISKHSKRLCNSSALKHFSPAVEDQFQNVQSFEPHESWKANISNNQENVSVLKSELFQAIFANANNSVVVSALEGVSFSLPDCCEKFYETLYAESVFDTEHKTLNFRPEWRRARQFRITGSRCYNIFTYRKTDWPEKAKKYFWPKSFENKHTRHGVQYEGHAREKYIELTSSHVVECGVFIVPKEPWMSFSSDGVVFENNFPKKLLEIKCPFQLSDVSVETLLNKCKRYLYLKDSMLQLKKRHPYYGQVQFGMAVLNLMKCDFIIYSNISNSIAVINVDYDPDFCLNFLSVLKTRYFVNMIHEICSYSRVFN